jgi:hypothetical protein
MLNDGSGSIECKQWIEKDSGGYSKIQNLRYFFTFRDNSCKLILSMGFVEREC